MIAELATIMAPVLVCTGLGIVWARMSMPFDNATASMVVYAIGSPALIFNSLVNIEVEFALVGQVMLAAVAFLTVTTAIAVPVLRLLGHDLRAFLPSLMHGNAGNLAMPLALFTFGEAGLALAAASFIVVSMSMYTLGVVISAGSMTVRSIARIPLVYAALAALVVAGFDIETPKWLDHTTATLGGLTIPLMLIMLGNSLAGFRVSALGTCAALGAIRLVVGFAVGVCVAWAMGLDNPERGVVILSSTMPIAVFNIVLAERSRRRPADVAGAIVISTLMFFCILPALLWFVLD